MNIASRLVKEFGLEQFQVTNSLKAFDEGATIPFLARYRKEVTGNLDEVQLRDLYHKFIYYKELEERRVTILESIQSQGKLTPELKKTIEDTVSKVELEDLYLPYKPKRVTRARKAIEAGLEPLCRFLSDCDDPKADIGAIAEGYLSPAAIEKGFDTAEKIIGGACDILAEELADDASVRKWLRELIVNEGSILSMVRKEFADKKTKFSMYHDYKEPVKSAPSHRVLAILRGEREKVLTVSIEFNQEKALGFCISKLVKHPTSAAAPLLRKTAQDSLNRLLSGPVETEVRKTLRESAEDEAFRVFGENLRMVLMAPPAGRKATIGIDPGFRSGCKLVTLDDTGKLLEFKAVYPHEPQNEKENATKVLCAMIARHCVALIGIGNGTASRETEQFVRDAIAEIPEEKRPLHVVVSETGASVYSASELAAKEFPDHDVTVRGAISIGRRLQDPLSELVKIDPKSIGVGQYQHDVDQKQLKAALDEVVQSCVNKVGVELNLASEEVLRHVCGLNGKIASAIIAYREQYGAFRSREALKKVPGIGVKTFEQAAGFLRIRDGAELLDNSAVHPERYEFVLHLSHALQTTVGALIGNTELLKKTDKKKYVTPQTCLETVTDIFEELEKPGRDPRSRFVYARFSDTVREISDCKEGMLLEGYVTNVTKFGAFVDIGVHQDGLLHVSELADRFVSDPATVVKVGQIVQVRILTVDPQLQRISLSMRRHQGLPEKKEKFPAGEEKNRPRVQSQTNTQSPLDRLKQWQRTDPKKRG